MKVIIVGGGLIGISLAKKILEKENYQITLIEAENQICQHQSGNNSGVIHSGILYQNNEMAIERTFRGSTELFDYAKRKNVPLRQTGKYIIGSTKEEINWLNSLKIDSINKKFDLKTLDDEEKKRLGLKKAVQGVYTPITGIIDYPALGQAMIDELNLCGRFKLITSSKADYYHLEDNKKTVYLKTGEKIIADKVIVCCGADGFFQALKDKASLSELTPLKVKGVFYKVKKPNKTSYLNREMMIYQVPNKHLPFVGVHLTPTINNENEVGPTAFPIIEDFRDLKYFLSTSVIKFVIKNYAYLINEVRKHLFPKVFYAREINVLFEKKLQLDFTKKRIGIRSQYLDTNGMFLKNYIIKEGECATHILNTPSPGATNCIEIAREIHDKLF